MTNNLVRRIYEHRESFADGFTKRYNVKTLVYFKAHETVTAALQREKNIKHWPREWRIDLIVAQNPEWRDLYDDCPLTRAMDCRVKPGNDDQHLL